MKAYADFWQRAKAFALDYIVILAYLAVLSLLFLSINRFTSGLQWLFAGRFQSQFTVILILTLPLAIYFAVGESSARQGTWGKQRLGLKVVDQSGNRIHFWRALARALLKFVPWEISHTLIWEIRYSTELSPTHLNIGFALVYFLIGLNIAAVGMSRAKQSLYDHITGTYVIASE